MSVRAGGGLPDLGPRGEGWFLGQVVILGAVAAAGLLGPAWSGSARALGAAAGVGLIAAGGLLAVRGIRDLGRSLTPFPRPRESAAMVDTGAYRLVRHPIYGGLTLAGIGWGLLTASLPALAGALILAAFLDLKSRREEVWLVEWFEGYERYRARTRRMIPWLY
jgi:protein-S-isoprenylcysteine O-methyltransferase Ste14